MDDTTPTTVPQEYYIPQKMKAFMSEPQGCALIAALEGQFQCSISIINDLLTISDGPNVDISQIESIIRDVWQKREIQQMIREAALNASCTHTCQTIIPRAYCAVVIYFSPDFQRRARYNDLIVEQFSGKVSIFGSEIAVNTARELMIECLTEHFGPLEIDIPMARRTTRMGYSPSAPPPFLPYPVQMGEPNAILTSTPPQPPAAPFSETLLSSSFDKHLLFPSDFSVPPPEPPKATNNVEKIKHWIPTDEVGKILGNRAAMKKQIEAQFNCVITVHTEVYSQFGMTAVEIMAQSKDQCQGARDAVMGLLKANQDVVSAKPPGGMDSGFNSPASTVESAGTPEKKGKHFHRSSFRDQPKVMLALTPRKSLTPPAE